MTASMSAGQYTGDEWDDDWEDEEELPACFEATDETSAGEGGHVLQALSVTLTRLHHELELIERALRSGERVSARSRIVREHVQRALDGLEGSALPGVDEARCALIYRWGEPPHVATRPDLPHRPIQPR